MWLKQIERIGENSEAEELKDQVLSECPKCGSHGSLERSKGKRPGYWCKRCGRRLNPDLKQ